MTDATATDTLETLAARAVGGDATALADLCRRLEVPVFRLCLRMLGDLQDAEDAAQDILVLVVTHLSQFEGRSALTTWVHRIAVRHVLARKHSRAEHSALDEDGLGALLDAGLAFAATRPPPSPEDRALATEVRLSCTQGMLMMLSRDERLALVLVELLGFDGAEVAELLEIGHAAVRQRLARARARLADFLQARCGVANPAAACRCETQVAGLRALGRPVDRRRLTLLSAGDLPAPQGDVHAATAELAAVRTLAAAFHRDGAFAAPATLRARVQQALPNLLAAPDPRRA